MNCHTCGCLTLPEKRIIVKAPDGTTEYFCNDNGCAEKRKKKLAAAKGNPTYEIINPPKK